MNRRCSLPFAASRRPLRAWPATFRAVCMALVVLCCVAPGAGQAASDVMLVLDNSGSMRKNDPDFLLKPAMSEFVAGLDATTRAGLLIFDEDVDYAVPLAGLDAATRAAIDAAVADIDYRGQYTNSPAAVERAIYELKKGGREDAARVIIFMTDGIVDTGNPEIDAEKTKWLREELAAAAAASGIRVFGVAFTENADFFLIQSLASKTGGEYFRALGAADLGGVFEDVRGQLAAAPAAVAPPAPAAPAPPPPPREASPPAPAAPTAAADAQSCLDTVSGEERALMEEAAPDAGMTAEQLCREMMMPAESGVIVKRPGEQAQALEPAPDEPGLDREAGLGIALLVIIALLLLALVAGVVWFIRRRGGGGAVALGEGAREASIPEAFLKDLQGVADDPAVQIGAKPLMIGRVRGSNPEHVDYFVINKGTVGRQHAIIQYRDFGFWLNDQGSVNGTFLNGERIEGERQLKHGDRIRFHKFEFEFSMPSMADAGHTVFADPNDPNATMVDDGTIAGSMIAAAAATGGHAPPARAARPDLGRLDPEDVFDVTGEGDVAAVSAGPSLDDFDDADDDTPTPERLDAMLDRAAAISAAEDADGGADEAFDAVDDAADDETAAPTAMPGAANLDDPDDFDAEASAFFDDDELGSTSSPYNVNAPAFHDEDDPADEDDVPDLVTARPIPTPADFDAAFTESETLVPTSPDAVDGGTEAERDISLDEFMQTETFDGALRERDAFADEDGDDATLRPEDVVTDLPSMDDFFDVTSEGTIPPVDPRADGDDEDDDGDGPRTPGRSQG